MIYNTRIDGQDGLFLENNSILTYEACVRKKSVRIERASAIRSLAIHKYIPLRFLLVLLREKRLIHMPVVSWEDPYENFLLKEQFVKEGDRDKSYRVSVENLIKGLFGMSWTLQEETDSLWRVYSHDKMSVRITTSVERLVKIVCSENDEWDVWIDKVRYRTSDEIDSWLDGCREVDNVNQFVNKMSESFFIKRKAFVAEKEFRVVVNYINGQKSFRPSFICFKVDPYNFISEYIVDPRLNDYDYMAIRAALIDAGAPQNAIRQSSLYRFQPRIVEMRYDPFEDF